MPDSDTEYIDENKPILRNSQSLERVEPFHPPRKKRVRRRKSPSDNLDRAGASRGPQLSPARKGLGFISPPWNSDDSIPISDSSSDGSATISEAMVSTASEDQPTTESGRPEDDIALAVSGKINPQSVIDVRILKETAAAAAAVVTEAHEQQSGRGDGSPFGTRVDSTRENVSQADFPRQPDRATIRSGLKLRTQSAAPARFDTRESNGTSPIFGNRCNSFADSAATSLAVIQPSSTRQDGPNASPQTETLPSFKQFTVRINQLNELAEVAVTQPYSHHHKQSFSSTTSHSPRLPYYPHPHPGTVQASPKSYSAYSARSPTSTTVSETQHYGPPPQYPGAAYYTDRRSSAATEATPNFPPSLPSASSSGDSHGHASSSTDGYPSSHTTPIDQPPTTEATRRLILPPPPGMPSNPAILHGGYKCDHLGCSATPFQTQYLLSSHKNVHSLDRPYYCAVKDCARSEGGRGFKRKNEMIRHGLVHNSPGYICPFCPEREHKYPRPDNLQRHVRVHHMDKDRDHPILRDVLAQRNEGAGRQRRRRTNATI